MRLSSTQVQGIVKGLLLYLQDHSAQLRLYGSRVDDQLKGGDIDLLLIVSGQQQAKLTGEKHVILTAIKKNIGEQKIDLLIATEGMLTEDPFLQLIYPKSIVLHQF